MKKIIDNHYIVIIICLLGVILATFLFLADIISLNDVNHNTLEQRGATQKTADTEKVNTDSNFGNNRKCLGLLEDFEKSIESPLKRRNVLDFCFSNQHDSCVALVASTSEKDVTMFQHEVYDMLTAKVIFQTDWSQWLSSEYEQDQQKAERMLECAN